jgi:drug/metabolite transporter (DMT)-like permease
LRKAVLQALIVTLIWGVSFLAIRIALEAAAPLGVVWMRNALGAAVLFAILRARGGPLLPEKQDRGRVLVLGALMAAHMLIQTLSMRFTTTMRAGWIVAFIPAVIAVGARLFLKQRMRAIGWFGIAVATSGVFVLTATRPDQLADVGLGDQLMLLSTLTWASYSLVSTSAVQRNGGLRIAFAALALSVVPTAAIATTLGQTWQSEPTVRAALALLFLGVCASAVAMWLFSSALAVLGPERTASFQYLQPFVTLAASFAFLAEPFTPAQFLGGPLVLAGVWFVQRGKREAPAPGAHIGAILGQRR